MTSGGSGKKTGKPPKSTVSLYGMKPEDALRRALSTPPPPKTPKAKKKG